MLKNVCISLALAATLAAIAPAAAQAADPPRPLNYTIVEMGGPGNTGKVYLHGTYGHNDLTVDRIGGDLIVKSLIGEPLAAGAGCAYDSARRWVLCPVASLYRVQANLYGADDAIRVTTPARYAADFEIWGGQGNDSLTVEWGPPAQDAVLLGGDENDVLTGASSTEHLWGGPGNDVIRPGGGQDSIDGGHGFITNTYNRNDGECAARTHGFWDRAYDTMPNGPEGIDTLDLSGLSYGVLADINICRLSDFDSRYVSPVFGIEHVVGTRYNDRLVGDGDHNVLTPGTGWDWVSGEGGYDRIDTRDGEKDTVRCGDAGDQYFMDSVEDRLGC